MLNRYIIETTKENFEIVYTEINSIMETYKNFNILFSKDNYIIISGNYNELINSAFVNYISLIIDEKEDYKDFNKKIPDGKFFVRVSGKNKNETENFENEIGKLLNGYGRISFKNPDFIIRAIYIDKWYLCILKYERNKKELESRRAPLRPFFSPVSLHPKYARYLINTSFTKEGDTIIDPFCGTGGILIEAALMERKIIGNDSSLNMVMGTKLNLKYFDIKDYEIYNEDISNLNINKKANAVVTDMPYGRSSGIDNHNIDDLYKIAFEKFSDMLIKNGKCSIIINDKNFLKYAYNYFDIIKIVPVYQHKSLIRQFVILNKIN